jgi:hypothetical protein
MIINLFFSKEKYFKKINKSINKYLKKLREREISIYKPENTFLFTPTTQRKLKNLRRDKPKWGALS